MAFKSAYSIDIQEVQLYEIALRAIAQNRPLRSVIEEATGNETVPYDAIYELNSEWRLLPSFDHHPSDAAHCLVSGAGLTHKASAENRAAMDTSATQQMTDSTGRISWVLRQEAGGGQNRRSARMVLQRCRSALRGHEEALEIPPYAWDGGEEPEIAVVYVISPDGEPFRVGFTIGNEFSDHQMDKNAFAGKPGATPLKYKAHRRPGDVHTHFLGADAFSFGDGVALCDGDRVEIEFSDLAARCASLFGSAIHPKSRNGKADLGLWRGGKWPTLFCYYWPFPSGRIVRKMLV